MNIVFIASTGGAVLNQLLSHNIIREKLYVLFRTEIVALLKKRKNVIHMYKY